MSREDDKVYDLEILNDNQVPSTLDNRKAEVMIDQSWLPFANKIREINVRGYRRVVQETTGLLADLKDHQEALADLRSVDLDINANLLRKQATLAELEEITESNQQLKEQRQRLEKNALDIQEAEQRLAQKAILVQEAELERRLRKLEKKK